MSATCRAWNCQQPMQWTTTPFCPWHFSLLSDVMQARLKVSVGRPDYQRTVAACLYALDRDRALLRRGL